MQAELIKHSAANVARPIRPALTVVLVVGAAVAAAGQPLELPRQPHSLTLSQPVAPSVHAATVRIILPPPAALARVEAHQSTGTLRTALPELEPVAVPAAPEPAALAMVRPEKVPLSAAPAKIVQPRPISEAEATGKLADARGKDVAAYSAAVKEIAASRRPAPIAMVDAGTRAAATRMAGTGDFSPSDSSRMAAVQSPARAMVGSIPMQPDAIPMVEPERVALAEPSERKLRSIASVSLQVSAKVNGAPAGRVSLLIRDSENISVQLSDILPILESAVEPVVFERLSALQGQAYVTFNDLRAAGLSVRFDAHDRLLLGKR